MKCHHDPENTRAVAALHSANSQIFARLSSGSMGPSEPGLLYSHDYSAVLCVVTGSLGHTAARSTITPTPSQRPTSYRIVSSLHALHGAGLDWQAAVTDRNFRTRRHDGKNSISAELEVPTG